MADRSLREASTGEWREIAEWDWVWFAAGRGCLHAVRDLDNHATADEDWFGMGRTECGLVGSMHIPGMFSRMSARRCKRCCARTGMPYGWQSPKNVDECRPIAERRIAALGGST